MCLYSGGACSWWGKQICIPPNKIRIIAATWVATKSHKKGVPSLFQSLTWNTEPWIEDAQSFLRGKPVNKAQREECGMMGSWKRVRRVGWVEFRENVEESTRDHIFKGFLKGILNSVGASVKHLSPKVTWPDCVYPKPHYGGIPTPF